MNFWQGSLILLRAIEPEDAPIFFRWNQDSERARSLDFIWPPTSLAAVTSWTTERSKLHLEKDEYQWIIETLTGEAAGSISTHACNPHTGTFSYGIDIVENFRRRGYAAEAIRLVLRYYFDELRYQKVTVSIHSSNCASLELHRSLGFQEEGRLRRMVYSHGQYEDEIWLGMTREEFSG